MGDFTNHEKFGHPPASDPLGVCEAQLADRRRLIREWNDRAKEMGFEGVSHALDVLKAIKLGPR